MNRPIGLVMLALLLSHVLLGSPAFADDGEDVDLQSAGFIFQGRGSQSSASDHIASNQQAYDYGPTCGLGGQAVCYQGAPCVADGTEGVKFDVFLEGEKVGEVCVTDQAAVEQEQVTPGRVLRAFRRLTWPESGLVVQPPGGTTLVNFPTNFYTENAAPTRQRVTLLRQGVLIEATPTTYTWYYGDGTSQATEAPGGPYPQLDITHDYGVVDTFQARVDTTYTGRYRLDGGPWIPIPETLTVQGTPQGLETIEASPTLVSY